MRVKIMGKRTTQELREYLSKFVDQAEMLGITHVTGTNIYFSPIDETGEELEIMREGEVLGGWNYTSPKKQQKAKKAKVMSFRDEVERLKKGFSGEG